MKIKLMLLAISTMVFLSCGDNAKKSENEAAPAEVKTEVVPADPMQDKGIGPIKSVALGEIDMEMAEQGKAVFTSMCSACHKMSKRFVGPALTGVTERRSPEWIMNMILNPEEMVEKNPIAKQLLAEYLSPMANQNLTEEQARQILEYFRTKTTDTSEE